MATGHELLDAGLFGIRQLSDPWVQIERWSCAIPVRSVSGCFARLPASSVTMYKKKVCWDAGGLTLKEWDSGVVLL